MIWKTLGTFFFNCPLSIICWEEQGLWGHINAALFHEESFITLCFKLLSSLNMQDISKLAFTIWSTWGRRNSKFWKNTDSTSKDVIYRANCYYNYWLHTISSFHQSNNTQQASPITSGIAPPLGFLKCNTDATVFKEANKTGFGICIRNDSGVLVAAYTSWLPSCITTLEGEAFYLLHVMHWTISLGLKSCG